MVCLSSVLFAVLGGLVFQKLKAGLREVLVGLRFGVCSVAVCLGFGSPRPLCVFWFLGVALMLPLFVLVFFFSLGCFVCLVLSLPFLYPFPFQRYGFCLVYEIRSSARSLLFFSCVLLLFSEGGWVSCLLCRVVCQFV